MSDQNQDIILKVEQALKSHSRNWLISFGLAVIIAIVLAVIVFRKNQKQDPYMEQGKNEIELLKRNNSLLDSLLKSKDTVLIENRRTEKRIIREYEKVPADVKSLDREQLRREVTNY